MGLLGGEKAELIIGSISKAECLNFFSQKIHNVVPVVPPEKEVSCSLGQTKNE